MKLLEGYKTEDFEQLFYEHPNFCGIGRQISFRFLGSLAGTLSSYNYLTSEEANLLLLAAIRDAYTPKGVFSLLDEAYEQDLAKTAICELTGTHVMFVIRNICNDIELLNTLRDVYVLDGYLIVRVNTEKGTFIIHKVPIRHKRKHKHKIDKVQIPLSIFWGVHEIIKTPQTFEL